MPEPRYVSTAQVASALGVSVTTIKRWVDEGILPAYKTPGGHRKLLLPDVLRIVRQEGFPHLDLSHLGPANAGEAGDPQALSLQLCTALRQGDERAVRAVLHGAYQAGMAVEVLADAVVAPAMRRLGHDWEKGRIDVFHEHRGTQLCAAALFELKGQLDLCADGERPVALGGGPERDPYLLANLLAQMVLFDAGWQAINLGPNTPLASFRKALTDFHPRLLWLSVSHLEDQEAFLRQYRELYEEAVQAGAAVAVGGRALAEHVRAGIPYTTFGDGLTHLAAFAGTLHPRPRRPRRGRPPKAPAGA
jgi:excisionase family DNA binding protein